MDLSRIRLLVTDVDGVLTDGTVYVDADGNESCRYSKRDGVLLPAMREAGIEVQAMTSEPNLDGHVRRLGKIHLPALSVTPDGKLEGLRNLVIGYNLRRGYEPNEAEALTLSEVAYIGDDLPDLPCLKAVDQAGGYAVVPTDGAEACRLSGAALGPDGGYGVLRFVCEQLLTARGYDCTRWPVSK